MPSRGSTIFSFLILAVLAIPGSARPDTLVLQDGRRVEGQLISVTRGWVEFQPIEDEDGVEQLRVAIAEVRSIQFDDGAEAGESSGRTTTFEIGGGGDRVEPQEPDGGLGGDDVIRPRRERSQRGRIGTVGGRDGTLGSRDRDTSVARDDQRRGRMITVPAATRWTDTGIDVTSGDIVSFSVAGTVGLGDDRSLGAEGDLDAAAPAPRRPLPDRPAGALIGRIGTSPDDTFFIGAERLPFRVRTSGRLFLGINDDTLADDTGAFQVAVTR
jgi:hypothetical protein